MKVCLVAHTLGVNLGGHFWCYLNWALGLCSLGCEVFWVELVSPDISEKEVQKSVFKLKDRLANYGLDECLVLFSLREKIFYSFLMPRDFDPEAVIDVDIIINLNYTTPSYLIGRFRKSVFLDMDPGLTQVWVSNGYLNLNRHDHYFTIGETVGRPEALFPDCGVIWHHIPPCVALDWWPVCFSSNRKAPFTTVSNWWSGEWVEDEEGWYLNDKRSGFLPYLSLPKLTDVPLELSLSVYKDDQECWIELPNRGWRIRDGFETLASPQDYQRYIQSSRGEFSCAKPSCARLKNAWVSDRTICYLASGKPAVVEHTGPSRFLPDWEGLFRFKSIDEAVSALNAVSEDYEQQCKKARLLAEEHFDAKKNLKLLLEVVLN